MLDLRWRMRPSVRPGVQAEPACRFPSCEADFMAIPRRRELPSKNFTRSVWTIAAWSCTLLPAAEPAGAGRAADGEGAARIAKLVSDLSSPDWKVRCAAVKDLGACGPAAEAAIPALTRRLSDTDPPIPKPGEKGRSSRYFVDPGPTIGELAAAALARIGPAAEPALRESLRTGTAHGQCCAALGLAHLGAKEAVAHLAGRLPATWRIAQETPHKSAPRAAMIAALGALKDPGAIPVLKQAMECDGFESNRCAAVRAVGEIGGSEALQALRDAYTPKYTSSVRVVAFQTLVKHFGRQAAPDVRKLRQDRDPRLQRIAAGLLPNVVEEGDTSTLRRNLASASPHDRRSAGQALANLNAPTAVPELLKALTDPDPKVRRSACHALSQGRYPSAVPGLTRFIQQAGSDSVRRDALAALVNTPGPESRAALCLLLLTHSDAQLRLAVLRVLQRRIHEDAVIQTAVVKAMREDPDDQVRAKAQEAVSRWKTLTSFPVKAR
jgi:HEAT repeat protein